MQQEKGKDLLERYIEGNATVEEQALLEAWYEQFEIIDRPDVGETETSEQLGRIRRILMGHSGQKQVRVKKIKIWYSIAAAAVLLIFLTAGFCFYFNATHGIPIAAHTRIRGISPGNYQETLTLDNGEKVLITKGLRGFIAQQGTTTIGSGNGEAIIYRTKGTETNVAYNTLVTARGEQSPYPLILADGTKVWLNAASSITFPVTFSGRDRVVKITGEALFEVVHNAAKPFRVVCAGQIVQDIGTRFDINAYANEPAIKTTLLEGAAKVITGNAFAMLKPGQQSTVTGNEKDTAITISDRVDTEQVLAWENGKFIFNNTDIRTVMRQVERWYDVDVEFNGNVRGVTFSGGFSRSMGFAKVLRSLEFTGVNFEVKGRKIIVK